MDQGNGALTRSPAIATGAAPFRGSWGVALIVMAVALAVYVLTLAPGLTFEHEGSDGGDLIAAAQTLGVPHPTGYPTYTILAWLFSHLPLSNIAYRVNLLSAVCAAATAGLLCRTVQVLLPEGRSAVVISAAAAWCLAFSPLLWSQAVISEVYALLAFFAALLLWLLARWWTGGGSAFLWLAALVVGLGLGGHLTLVFVVPAALLLVRGQSTSGLLPRFRPGATLLAMGLFVAGLGTYAYLPVAAGQRPPINWGNPHTWDGFLWVVSGEPYQHLAFGVDLEDAPVRLALWAGMLGDQFGWWGLAIAMLGAWWGWNHDRRMVAFGLAWMSIVYFYSFWYNTADSYVYLVPALLILAVWWAMGAQNLLAVAMSRAPHWRRVFLIVLLALPVASLGLHWQAADLSDDWTAHDYMENTLAAVGPGALVLVQADRSTFALWYGVYAEGRRPDVAVVNVPLLAYAWYRGNVRHLYPGLEVPEPGVPEPLTDEMARDLIEGNLGRRPIYATDPADTWSQWFEVQQEGDAELYRISRGG